LRWVSKAAMASSFLRPNFASVVPLRVTMCQDNCAGSYTANHRLSRRQARPTLRPQRSGIAIDRLRSGGAESAELGHARVLCLPAVAVLPTSPPIPGTTRASPDAHRGSAPRSPQSPGGNV
jgi:hypothetical protein